MMAGNANSGGFRPTAPQNNYAVSATGGNGNSGQPARYVAGMPYGEGADFMDLQSMARMESAPATPSAAGARREVTQVAESQPLVPLSASSMMPDVPVTDGAAMGPGGGLESLGLNASQETEQEAAKARIAAYRPALVYMASRPETSPETRMFIRQLIGE